MPHRLKTTANDALDDGESDLDLNNVNDSSESTLPTDPTLPGLAGLSLFDVRISSLPFNDDRKEDLAEVSRTFISEKRRRQFSCSGHFLGRRSSRGMTIV